MSLFYAAKLIHSFKMTKTEIEFLVFLTLIGYNLTTYW